MFKKVLYSKINDIIHKLGFDLRRFPTRDQSILLKYLSDNKVNNCFDIGANTGQYARFIRSLGFKGHIYSFEPQQNAFNILQKNASGSDKWHTFNIALGDAESKSTLNISKNSVSSSFLDLNEYLVKAVPETAYISREEVLITRLDNFLKKRNFHEKFFLKIDSQGFESKILSGAAGVFDSIYALQLELSFVSIYNGEQLFQEVKDFVESKGFFLSSIENGFADMETGRLLQVDTIFLRKF